MASAEVRILAPIPGRQAIGVEVPNPARHTVTLGDILASEEAADATHPLDVAIGRDITGQAIMTNLGQMPHILIAGATGSGKSSSINSIITTILMRCTPEQVRLILVDPKMVEMRQYANVPHLLTQPVIDPKKAANALGWAVREMERRYELLSRVGCRDITGYNEMYEAALAAGGGEAASGDDEDEALRRLPFIVIVVDELSDLMMVAPREVEDAIWRLAQDGPRRRRAPRGRHAATLHQRHHRGHQGQHPGPHGHVGVEPHRQPGHPGPGRGRAPRRQRRHAPARRHGRDRPEDPGGVGQRGGDPSR